MPFRPKLRKKIFPLLLMTKKILNVLEVSQLPKIYVSQKHSMKYLFSFIPGGFGIFWDQWGLGKFHRHEKLSAAILAPDWRRTVSVWGKMPWTAPSKSVIIGLLPRHIGFTWICMFRNYLEFSGRESTGIVRKISWAQSRTRDCSRKLGLNLSSTKKNTQQLIQ